MKIKLSKSQWENAGKKAGWIKTTSNKNHRVFDNKKEALKFLSDHALMSVGWKAGNDMMEACYWNGKVYITKNKDGAITNESGTGKKAGWIKEANIIKTAWGFPYAWDTQRFPKDSGLEPKLYWGVRAIFEASKWNNYKPSFDFVPDRQSFKGDKDAPEVSDFISWLNKEAIPAFKKDKGVQSWSSNSGEIYTKESDKYVFMASNNRSYGYTYIGAWTKETKPASESQPEPKLETKPEITVPPKIDVESNQENKKV